MLPVSLDCQFLITPSSCGPYVASFSRLSVLYYPFVLCTLCCQFLWTVRVWLSLRLVYPMLPVSLDCSFLITPSSCVPYVASFSGLSVFDYPFVLCTLCYQFLWIVRFWLPLRPVYPMLPVSLDCPFLITPLSCVPYVTSFSGLSVSDYPFVLWTICCQFLSIVSFVLPLRLVYPILPVSLDCQFWLTFVLLPVSLDCPFLFTPSSCVPYVASFSGLSVFDYPFVLCNLCYQFLWIVSFWLPLRLVDPMLPVSLDCQFCITPSSCVPYVASFSGLSVFDYPFVLCTQCCQFLWIVRFWLPLRLVYPMLPVSLDCQFLITPSSCGPYVASFSRLSVCITTSSYVPHFASFSGLSVLITPSSCCQFLWIVCFWLPLRLVYSMLPESLDCQFLITLSSCVPYVASFSGLSVFDYPFVLCTLYCQFLWIVRFWLPLRLVASFSGLSVFDYPFVLCTLCCQFLWIVRFWLPLLLVYPMLPVSLDCPFLITPSSCVPNVTSFSGFSVFDYPFVLCTLCCQFLWIVCFWLPLRLVYSMLPVSLDCQFLFTPSSCGPYVASFSGLSVLITPSPCCQFLWIVRFWLPLRLVYPMLPVSLDCQFLITPSSCVPYDASFSRLLVLYYPFVLCTLCCQFLWIVSFDHSFVLLPVSLDCLFFITPSSCVPYVTSFSGLSVSDYPFVLCTLCCQFLSIVRFVLPLRLVYPMLPVSLDCQFWLPLRLAASFSELSVSDYPFVLCTLCCQFLWIVRSWLPLRLVYSMLPVSLDCPFLITPSSCVPYVASFSGLSVFDYPFVLCTLCYQFLWIVSLWLPLRLVDHMLPVSLDCQFWLPLRLVASFSGLSVFDYPFVLCTLCYQFLWIVSFWLPLRLVYPMMLVSLDF